MTQFGRQRPAAEHRSMGNYDAADRRLVLLPVPDWIGYRASRANVWRRLRLDAGDVAAVCVGCGAETDVAAVAHSPRCKA